MRKLSALLAVVVLLLSQGAVWAVWEGNAGVGSAGNFPGSGMYALSDMFPKNTLVDIQNLETGLSVRAVVVGLSGVPGLVASVSPEVAESLNIKEGSVSRVRIFVPSDTSEVTVDGFTGPVNDSIDSNDPDVNPAAFVASEYPLEAGTVYDETVNMSVADAEEADAENTGETVVMTDPVEETAETGDSLIVSQPDNEPEVVSEVAVFEPVEEVEPLDSENTDDQVFTDDPVVAVVPPVKEKEETEEVTVDAEVMEVEEIALVPADMNPPPADGSYVDELVPEVAPVSYAEPVGVDTGIVAEVEEEADSIASAEVNEEIEEESFISEYIPSYVEKEEPVTDTRDLEPAVVVSVPSGTLKKGYYVQIGSYIEPENVRKIVDSYSGKYPIACMDSAASGAKKILVGSLAADETGAVLEFFQKEGFKDAFVYVIN